MFNHTYETTACSSYVLRDIRTSPIRAKINGEMKKVTTSKGLPLKDVFLVSPYSKAIPPFHHPVLVEPESGKPFIVVDQRPNAVVSRDGTTKVSQTSGYDFLNLRAALEWLWMNGYYDDLSLLGAIPHRAYARLVSENLTRRLGLTADVQQKLAALSGYYYQCLFKPSAVVNEDTQLSMAVRNRNYQAIPVEVTLPLIQQLPILTDLDSFCEAVIQTIPNPRLTKLNPAFMISISAGVWFGNAAKEVVAAALEYPPAFLAMVFTALNDRTMHGAQFSKLIDQIAKPNTANDFNTSIRAYLEKSHDV